MIANIRAAAPEAGSLFTPPFGFSQNVLPTWLAEPKSGFQAEFAFLDGGNRPGEQITKFELLDLFISVGGQLMVRDTKLRKRKELARRMAEGRK